MFEGEADAGAMFVAKQYPRCGIHNVIDAPDVTSASRTVRSDWWDGAERMNVGDEVTPLAMVQAVAATRFGTPRTLSTAVTWIFTLRSPSYSMRAIFLLDRPAAMSSSTCR